jgi:hypothetical protein
VARAGKAATGYALRVFPRTINTSTRRQKNQTNIYTYAQPTIKTSASNPGSKFGRQGGSDLDRREQPWLMPLDTLVTLSHLHL